MAINAAKQRAAISNATVLERASTIQSGINGDRAGSSVKHRDSRLAEVLSIAEKKGLLSGARTLVVRGRMPVQLVAQAKLRTGITSDSKLLEAALVSIALSDDYAEWLLSQRGTVSADLDLEF